MQNTQRLNLQSPLPIILIAAVVQGLALYLLHQSVSQQVWPATDAGWLLSLYALSVIVPSTIQLLSEHVRSRTFWIVVGVVGVVYFGFGRQLATTMSDESLQRFFDSDDVVPSAFIMGLLWLLAMPFVQVWLTTGSFDYKGEQYKLLFATAWRNKLLLAEAAAFTGIFWLLLLLWQTLFNMLGIGFFKALFREPVFIYPVTTLVFGIALHLIGSIEKVTDAILEQVLNVLKWLAIVAGFILALFTVALTFKLPGLVVSEQKFISAAWLLWLVAVIVLLLNAAYRDGTVERPYPAWIAFALRCIIPLTVVISATALYALAIRATHYGLTVERVWAFIVAGTLLLYSAGYSFAALSKAQWLKRIAPVNVGVALTLIATLGLTLTPVLSPYRLAANSQYRAAMASKAEETSENRLSPFQYLRFQAGQYGRTKLQALSTVQDHPDAARIRGLAARVIKARNWNDLRIVDDVDSSLSRLTLSPTKHEIDPQLRQRLAAAIIALRIGRIDGSETRLGGAFIDLNGDSTDEFVLLYEGGGQVFQRVGDVWQFTGRLASIARTAQNFQGQLQSVAEGNVSAKTAEWKNLQVGEREYRINIGQ
jgi:hypothetical protein